jgi:hypothetical protein
VSSEVLPLVPLVAIQARFKCLLDRGKKCWTRSAGTSMGTSSPLIISAILSRPISTPFWGFLGGAQYRGGCSLRQDRRRNDDINPA